jgi:YD repeat-containing protein
VIPHSRSTLLVGVIAFFIAFGGAEALANITPPSTSGPALQVNVSVLGTLAHGGYQGADALSQSDLTLLVPPSSATLIYDGAGRLKEDAYWTYSWDGLNRLEQMERKTGTFTEQGVQQERLNFGYDADGRRTEWRHTVTYTPTPRRK